MTLVFTLGLMAFCAVAVLGWPLLRRQGDAQERTAFDRAIYADQLDEIDRDAARGVIGAKEAAAARAEVERRALTILDADERARPPGRHTFGRAFTVALIVALPAAAGLGYLVLGRPDLPAQPFAARPKPPAATPGAPGAPAEMPSPEALAALAQMIEARLAEAPDESQGWTLLIRLYRRLGRAADADAAFRTALRTSPDAARRAAVALAYGEALTGIEGGIVTPAARAAFDIARAARPDDPAARYYHGLALAQAGDAAAALAIWRDIEKTAPADAPWRDTLKSDIERLAKESAPR